MANRWGIKIPREIFSLASTEDNTETQSLDITTYVIATPENSLKEAALNANSCTVKILGDAIEGEARDVARKHVEIALQEQKRLGVSDKPVLLLSGGECTVTRRGDGIGGPNAEYVLAATIALNAAPGIHVLSCDTDGVDGAAEVAGAYSGPDTLKRARRYGIDPVEMLSINDSHSFFENLGGQIITGPTYTNVNDFRAILIYPLTPTGDGH
jgi:hydroxypyruvate reductase